MSLEEKISVLNRDYGSEIFWNWTNHFILPKKSSSNIKSMWSNQITTSNSFDLLSENSSYRLDANNGRAIENITMLRVTQTKAMNEIIPVSQLKKM